MSVKSCCYKDCENYMINNVPNGSFTLFKFPKDYERCKKWMDLGQVDGIIPQTSLLMCSQHFERNKYLSVNPRRTVLIGAALPFDYNKETSPKEPTAELKTVSSDDKINIGEETCIEQAATTYMYFDNDQVEDIQEHKEIVEEEEQFQVESTIVNDDDGNVLTYSELSLGSADESTEEQDDENVIIADDVLEKQVVIVSSNDSYKLSRRQEVTQANKKRKIIESLNTDSTNANEVSVRPKSKTIGNRNIYAQQLISKTRGVLKKPLTTVVVQEDGNIPEGNNTAQIEIDTHTLIDEQHITTFIFKGEEYVQMPKDYYLNEKLILLQKLKQYENALKNIRQHVNLLDLS